MVRGFFLQGSEVSARFSLIACSCSSLMEKRPILWSWISTITLLVLHFWTCLLRDEVAWVQALRVFITTSCCYCLQVACRIVTIFCVLALFVQDQVLVAQLRWNGRESPSPNFSSLLLGWGSRQKLKTLRLVMVSFLLELLIVLHQQFLILGPLQQKSLVWVTTTAPRLLSRAVLWVWTQSTRIQWTAICLSILLYSIPTHPLLFEFLV